MTGQRTVVVRQSTGHCKRCGKPLTDPESIAQGIGPECREKHQAQQAVKAARARAFSQGQPVQVGSLTYQRDGVLWVDQTGFHLTNQALQDYLQRYGWIETGGRGHELHS